MNLSLHNVPVVDPVVYLADSASPYLFSCWLRGLPDGVRARVLVSAALGGQGLVELNQNPKVGTVEHILGGELLPELVRDMVARPGVPRIYIPLSLERVPLQFRTGVQLPEVTPHYTLLRQLWQWGFREVVFVEPGSETILRIPHLLDEFKGRHQGQRCFVVGNGPSLNQIDMSRLKGEITLGSNRCYLGYAQWGFPFTYWGIYDAYQIEEYHSVYEQHVPAETVKFFPAAYLPLLGLEDGCPIDCSWPDPLRRDFSDEPGCVYRGFTVTYMLLQIAAVMGCDPIILIGADHRYELSRRGYSRLLRSARRGLARHFRGGRLYGTLLAGQRAWRKTGASGAPPLWSTGDAAHPTHFTASYTDGGRNRFLPPEPEEAELDFACAQAWAIANRREILNATPGTALESFPKVSFESLF